jgi:hypothetical protein
MGQAAAVKLAIDLMHFPSQVRSVRSAPLPDDVLILVRIAAGDEEATREAAEAAGRPRDVIREAAAFFIEQVLLHPGADSYRVLGARPEAPYGELRRNMALLLKWLHPDSDRQGQRVVFATRVTRAWNDLKTQERRAAYDRSQRVSKAQKSFLRRKDRARAQSNRQGSKPRWDYAGPQDVYRRSLQMYSDGRGGFLRRILLLLFGRGPYDRSEQ